MMAHSKGLGLDLEILKRLSRDRLIRILEEAPGPKELIIDGDLVKLLDRIADANILRVHGVGKMFRLQGVPPSTASNQLVYLIRPTLLNIKYMADHVHSLRQQHPHLQFHLVCVPRILFGASQLMEEEGLYGIIHVHEFTPDFIPLDEDLLSLEMHSFFRDTLLDGDYSGGVVIAKALCTLQSLYGSFVNIVSHGRAAHAVMKAFGKLKEDQSSNKTSLSPNSSRTRSEIGHLFVFDREADFVTPLLTQLTYEGALDEHYGIRAGVVEFPKEVVGTDHPSKVPLNSRDSVFENIRNRHFAGVAGYLVRKARDLQERKQTTSSMTPAQMKNFVTNDLKTIQIAQKSLSLHISACEGITKNTRKDFDVQLTTEHGLVTGATSANEAKNYVEDCLARQVPSKITLRMLCLYSITQKGLNKRDYESFSSQVLSSHGYQHMLTLFRLKRMGLLLLEDFGEEPNGESKQKQVLRQMVLSIGSKKSSSWCSLTKKLKLIPDAEEQIDLHNPTHMSYVFNGAYTPLIPHLISESLTKGVASLVEAFKLIPGTSDVYIANDGSTTPIPRVAVVLIVGGITFAEVAALRLLSVSTSTKIIIASTCTITGTSLVSSAIDL